MCMILTWIIWRVLEKAILLTFLTFICELLLQTSFTMSDFTTANSELERLYVDLATLIREKGFELLLQAYLVSGKIRGRRELHDKLVAWANARATGVVEFDFTTDDREVELSSAITLGTVGYVRAQLGVPEGDFTFTVLRPGSTQGKWSRYNSNAELLESDAMGDFGTGAGAGFDQSKLDGVIRHAQECGDAGILLSESAAYCCASGTSIRLDGVDISTLPQASEVNKKTGLTGLIAKPQVLAFVNAVSARCAALGYTQMVVSNRNDQKAAGMRFTMVDGYIDTVNPTGERIVVDAGGGTYKVYHQNGLARTHLGDIAYDQDAVLAELAAQA